MDCVDGKYAYKCAECCGKYVLEIRYCHTCFMSGYCKCNSQFKTRWDCFGDESCKLTSFGAKCSNVCVYKDFYFIRGQHCKFVSCDAT